MAHHREGQGQPGSWALCRCKHNTANPRIILGALGLGKCTCPMGGWGSTGHLADRWSLEWDRPQFCSGEEGGRLWFKEQQGKVGMTYKDRGARGRGEQGSTTGMSWGSCWDVSVKEICFSTFAEEVYCQGKGRTDMPPRDQYPKDRWTALLGNGARHHPPKEESNTAQGEVSLWAACLQHQHQTKTHQSPPETPQATQVASVEWDGHMGTLCSCTPALTHPPHLPCLSSLTPSGFSTPWNTHYPTDQKALAGGAVKRSAPPVRENKMTWSMMRHILKDLHVSLACSKHICMTISQWPETELLF